MPRQASAAAAELPWRPFCHGKILTHATFTQGPLQASELPATSCMQAQPEYSMWIWIMPCSSIMHRSHAGLRRNLGLLVLPGAQPQQQD